MPEKRQTALDSVWKKLDGQADSVAAGGVEAIEQALGAVAGIVEETLGRLLPTALGAERRVTEAMSYATLGGGKRIRPFLVLAGSRLFGVAPENALRVAAAIEIVHCYSLAHDDLPAMDNADLRRGRPTVHKKFDQATSILAGDGLLTLAFEVLAEPATHDDAAVRADLVLSLAQAAGWAGMVGGQMIDLQAEHAKLDLDAIKRLQRLKTGALIGFSCTAGAILGRAEGKAKAALASYAEDLGLAFQIVDDLLDTEGNAAAIGKPVGQDQAMGKATFVSLLGLKGAREEANRLSAAAIERLAGLGPVADPLRAMSHFVVKRGH